MNEQSNNTVPLILIVEDNIDNIQVIVDIIKIEKYQIAISISAEDALEKLTAFKLKPNLILLDLGLPGMSGEKLLDILKENYPQIPIIITTGSNSPEIIVRCIKTGAFDFLVKPLDRVRTITSINNAINLEEIENETQCLKRQLLQEELKCPEAFSKIITANNKMRSMFEYIEAIARTRQPVLILGETGTGKELFARAVHLASGRKGKFIPVNAAGLEDHLFNDTLFGHIKGAFTGANTARKGLIEAATDGTIFLDEIGDITKSAQVKLLRLLQENEYLPEGADKYICSKARVVLATNHNLEKLVQEKEFRTDLYYRLKAHSIYIPPLRERKDDIPLLLDHFLKHTAKEIGIEVPLYNEEILSLLRSYNFPGNVREFSGLVYEAIVKHSGISLSTKYFCINIDNNNLNKDIEVKNFDSLSEYFNSNSTLPSLDYVTKTLINEALIRANNNKTLAAKLINMNRGTLRNRLDDYSESGK